MVIWTEVDSIVGQRTCEKESCKTREAAYTYRYTSVIFNLSQLFKGQLCLSEGIM